MWYSTSITQKRPVPSLVVFSSDTERRIWRVVMRSPGRTGSPKVMTLSLITASGRPSVSFRSKWTFRGTWGSDTPGAQWWGRNQTESIDGGAIGPPASSSATASSQ